jgi:hypothetical protein
MSRCVQTFDRYYISLIVHLPLIPIISNLQCLFGYGNNLSYNCVKQEYGLFHSISEFCQFSHYVLLGALLSMLSKNSHLITQRTRCIGYLVYTNGGLYICPFGDLIVFLIDLIYHH